ncbi:MAG TPA: hypothetical protein PLP42_05655 [Acidobacteriota bacterium]|nr:hypothetical protein [Acidobacteriota bacterium]
MGNALHVLDFSAMSIDFRIRDFLYPRAIWSLHRTFERNQWVCTDLLQEYQFRRLKLILNRAWQKIPYYRSQFKALGLHPNDIKSLADFACLPKLSKQALRENRDALLAEDAAEHGPIPCATSGSTGEPLRFYLDRHAQVLEFVYYWRYWSWAGYGLGASFAELGSHHFIVRKALCDRATHVQPHLRRLLLNSNLICDAGCREMAETLRRSRPRFLKGVGSALYFLALKFKQLGITDVKFDAVFSTGDLVTEMCRNTIEAVFSCRLLDSYGHMERTVAVSQCQQGSYHIHSDYGLLEVEETEDRGNRSRLGRVLGTSLHNLAMPLIRYEVGDTVELFDEPRSCGCGRSFPLIKAIHGRLEDVVVTPDGRIITALFIVPKFVCGVRCVQFIQAAPDRLEILVVPNTEWNPTTAELLKEYVRRTVGETMKTAVHAVKTEDLCRDPSGKLRAIIGMNSGFLNPAL